MSAIRLVRQELTGDFARPTLFVARCRACNSRLTDMRERRGAKREGREAMAHHVCRSGREDGRELERAAA